MTDSVVTVGKSDTHASARKARERMDLGMIGLGRMGANMSERLIRGKHRVVGYARGAETLAAARARGVQTVDSLAAMVKALPSPRVLWIMVPAGPPVDETLQT